VYTMFSPYLPSPALPHFLPPHTDTKRGPVFPSCKRQKDDISMYICIIAWFESTLLFSSFYLNPSLMVISLGLKIVFSFLYRVYLNNIHLLDFLLLSFPLSCDLPLEWLLFHNIAMFC
jgi:hypothetical protein